MCWQDKKKQTANSWLLRRLEDCPLVLYGLLLIGVPLLLLACIFLLATVVVLPVAFLNGWIS